ncbi:MAG TPA: nucleoside-diphosphate sugar epimerase/dehydratase [Nocardioidaceae bacterium]|nr:nucleoside-diphosphate sugar epimerase/dehydratase [Nocardioidaceae bacterium]
MNNLLIERLRMRRRDLLMAYDGAAIVLAYLVFTLLRYEDGLTRDVANSAILLGLVAVLAQWGLGSLARLYHGRTTVASLDETLFLSAITATAGMLAGLINAVADPFLVARSVPFGGTFTALFLMLLGRAIWRGYVRRAEVVVDEGGRATLVYGAGDAGRQLVRSMLVTPGSDMRPVGFLDDDRWKQRLRVHGVSVLGGRGDLAAASKTDAELLVIAAPSAGPGLVRDVSNAAREIGLAVKVLPGVGEMLGRRDISIRDVRDIDVQDLLGRGAVETDVAAIAGYVTGKRVLVTGAGGSIGSELCRQLHTYGPAELIMLDRDESALHAVQLALHGKALLDSSEVVLADIRDRSAIDRVFLDREPEVVFHAAALKHLPMLEQYPSEALKTNVLGTANVLEAAAMVGVERFVNISTDKAADPTSVLGYSKRVAERLTAAIAADTSGTYLSVRFGNVLGTRGSVLTSFASQIANGGPVTVTHPEVTRYFMTAQEAVQLVIQAAAIGDDGEVLILDMGEPVRILDVAKQLIAQSGSDVDIVFTGLREGEKLHEHLYGSGETGDRPVHPLVSHVSVPSLRISRVRHEVTETWNSPPEGVVDQLTTWSVAEEGTLAEERELMARQWSGMEA